MTPVLTVLLASVQSEPADHVGAGEAESGAREAQSRRPGEEPPTARAHVKALTFSLISAQSTARYTVCA